MDGKELFDRRRELVKTIADRHVEQFNALMQSANVNAKVGKVYAYSDAYKFDIVVNDEVAIYVTTYLESKTVKECGFSCRDRDLIASDAIYQVYRALYSIGYPVTAEEQDEYERLANEAFEKSRRINEQRQKERKEKLEKAMSKLKDGAILIKDGYKRIRIDKVCDKTVKYVDLYQDWKDRRMDKADFVFNFFISMGCEVSEE